MSIWIGKVICELLYVDLLDKVILVNSDNFWVVIEIIIFGKWL